MKHIYKSGEKFGKWTLMQYLGGGGNGEVWRCKNENGKEGAIKLLKTIKPKSYSRFLDETHILEQNSDINGIIPMIDKNLPADTSFIDPILCHASCRKCGIIFKG